MSDSASKDGVVVVAAGANLGEADVIRAVLQSEGIPAFVPAERAANTLSHLQLAVSGYNVRVAVARRDAERAVAVLREHRPPDDPSWSADQEEQAAAPAPADEAARLAARSAIYSLFFPLFSLLLISWLIRAARRASAHGVRDRRTYQRRMLLGSLVALTYLILFLCALPYILALFGDSLRRGFMGMDPP